MNRAPTEHMDRSSIAFSEEGRNDGACTMGKTRLNRAKYSLMHMFSHGQQ